MTRCWQATRTRAPACSRPRPSGSVQDVDVTVFRDDLGQGHSLEDLSAPTAVAHARMFFNRPDNDLASAQAPTFALTPQGAMRDALRRDYQAMAGMIFGEAPAFDAILDSVATLEQRVNASAPIEGSARE